MFHEFLLPLNYYAPKVQSVRNHKKLAEQAPFTADTLAIGFMKLA
jgi:hypothetical protein